MVARSPDSPLFFKGGSPFPHAIAFRAVDNFRNLDHPDVLETLRYIEGIPYYLRQLLSLNFEHMPVIEGPNRGVETDRHGIIIEEFTDYTVVRRELGSSSLPSSHVDMNRATLLRTPIQVRNVLFGPSSIGRFNPPNVSVHNIGFEAILVNSGSATLFFPDSVIWDYNVGHYLSMEDTGIEVPLREEDLVIIGSRVANGWLEIEPGLKITYVCLPRWNPYIVMPVQRV